MPYTGDKIAVTCPECLGEGYVEIRKNYKLTGKKSFALNAAVMVQQSQHTIARNG